MREHGSTAAGKRNWQSRVRAHLLLWTVLYLAYLLVLFCCQRKLIFPGVNMRVEAKPPAQFGLEVWPLTTPSGRVESFFLPSPAAAKGERTQALVFAHGNGEVIDEWVGEFDSFRELGFSVLLVEYPGYGRSAGSPSSAAIRLTMLAAYDRLAADPRVESARIVGLGESLGGGAICALARERPLQALILQSTFPSLKMFAARYFAPSFLMLDEFDNEAALKAFGGPVLVMHGRHDALVPWRQGQRLAAASARSTFKLYDCGHGCWFAGPEVWRDMKEFVLKVNPPQRGS